MNRKESIERIVYALKQGGNAEPFLYNELNNAQDDYLKLRDAKSNGCCHEMSIREILAYDELIMEAHGGLMNLQYARDAYCQILEDERTLKPEVEDEYELSDEDIASAEPQETWPYDYCRHLDPTCGYGPPLTDCDFQSGRCIRPCADAEPKHVIEDYPGDDYE